ncbi:hypothetical protein LTR10_019304 [Elasticomyces elasticus]|uniref:Uncharacterized protein n=1 Tax=Exophiala sideris TaxID=1016849 RepID=A0ABR0IXK2_9EURO|nr:hypothetical protein LTR10_019304 [Elasticomyces elasticus]KAK5021982.1 hypothetical protein LTS07_010564 [Exophiala sideris]KAK5026045.1 hypothetical protein LTR13_010202 [Exophiala sideris]KAK5050732.1 hypothetical protein LTR69_010588 [Exophiala sideris]KAK5177217.1 hypothetical protein LTR44_010345 [Eurotiomycetes sp. CCFEE 6388]
MKLTPSLLVRNFLASINPPLPPRSPGESKRLLNVLESAFQRHLDDIHPSPKATESKDGADTNASIPNPAQRLTHSTHSHLDSILSHPLLKRKSTTFVPPHNLSATAVATFDAALTGKSLDLHLVQFCALQYLEGLEKNETVPEDGRLGSRLSNWFTTMSREDKLSFWMNRKSLRTLVRVLYADGLEAEVWLWLRDLYERQFETSIFLTSDNNAPNAKVYLQAEDILVATMISETTARRSLQEATEQYVQACRYRQLKGQSGMAGQAGVNAAFRPLRNAWHCVAAAIVSRRNNHGIPAQLFDSLLDYGLSVTHSPIDHSFVRVYHPTSPSAQILCSKVRSDTSHLRPFSKWQRQLSKRMSRKVFLTTLLDGAQLSLEQSRANDARVLLDCAEQEYPEFLSDSKDLETEKRLEVAQAAMLVRRFEARARLRSTPAPVLA